jgi:hypothetical protein
MKRTGGHMEKISHAWFKIIKGSILKESTSEAHDKCNKQH